MKVYHPALFDGECLRRLEVCTVYYTARAWDAWNSRETSRHKGAASLSSSLEAAMEIAEGWPLPASYFVIHQLPALVLVGEPSLAVVLADAHTNPFAGWRPRSFDVLRTGTPISLVLRAFASRRTWAGEPHADTLVTGMPDPAQDLERLGSSFTTWSSSLARVGSPLVWTSESRKHSAVAMQTIQDTFRDLNCALDIEDSST